MTPDHVDGWMTLWSKRGALVLVGWFASSAYHATLTATTAEETLKTVQTVTIPKLAAAGGCQEKRANIAEGEIAAPQGLLNCPSIKQVIKRASVPPAEHPIKP